MAQSCVFFKTLSMWPSSRFLLNNSFSKLHIGGFSNSARMKLKELNIPEKPKKPSSPYIQFIKENQSILSKNHPDWKQTQIFKQCAEDWKNISSEKKEKFQNVYKSEKDTYDKAILKYEAMLSPVQKEAIKNAETEKKKSKENREKKKLFKETNKPKRPRTPFMIYLLEESKMRNMGLKDLMSDCKQKWALLQDKEKQKYSEQFQAEKKVYESAMKIWEEKMVQQGHSNLVRTKTLQEKRPSRIKETKSLK